MRVGRLSVRHGGPRLPLTLLAVALLALAAAAVTTYVGNADLAPGRVTAILLGDYAGASGFEVYSVIDVRLPRALAALLAGAALGLSGALFQQLTDNPLGSPDIIGFTSGAATGAVLVILLGVPAPGGIAGGAVLGGLVTAAAIYALAWRGGLDGLRLILVGIGVGAVLAALRSYLISRAELGEAQSAYRWLVGSLAGRTWDELALAGAAAVVLVPATVLLHRPLDRLAAGEELAATQGLDVGRTRLAVALVGTAWVAVAVVLAGPVGFVALAAPHVARMLTRRPGPQLASSALVGAALVAVADVGAMRLFAPTTLPVGVVTGVLGGLYLLWLLHRRRGVDR